MTLLSITQGALRGVGEYEDPATIVGNSNRTAVQVLAICKRSLAFTAGLCQWQRLVAEATITTVALDYDYALPTDYDYILNETMFDRTMSRQVRGPISAEAWQQLQAFPTSAVLNSVFRMRGNLVLLSPTPDTVRNIRYEYISTNQCESSIGVGQASWQADADVARVPELLLQQDLEWRFLKSKGLPYTTEFDEYVSALQRAIARDGGKPRINMNRPALADAVLTANVPEGSWA